MARKNGRRPTGKKITVTVGDFVLLGSTKASYPAHWYLGEVLAIDGDALFIGRSTLNGDSRHEVSHKEDVRARGTITELVRIQRAAEEDVRQLNAAIRESESALGAARDRLFARLDELAAGGLAIIPPDFDAIEAREENVRAIVSRDDEERMAAADARA